MQIILQILTIIGAVTLFLYGLNLFSNGLQKVAGNRFRSILSSLTANPFKGVLTGVGMTAAIQSSTATTIMVVSLASAGLLSLTQSIGVIMGANIGTTVTSWFLALFGFSYDISTFALPIIAIGFILLRAKKNEDYINIGEMTMGFALFFLGFTKLRETADVLITNIDLSGLHAWTNLCIGPINLSVILFLVIGTALTMCFQSSAATMAIIMMLITTGAIPFKMAAAMILGENIGTTIAANLAASVGNRTAKRAALAHTVFNIIGVIWVLCIFPWFLKFIGIIVSAFGAADPNTVDFTNASEANSVRDSLLYSVTTMHTLFNLANTLILVWFIPQIENLVKRLIPSGPKDEEFRLKYIQGGPLSTAELSLDEAKQEIIHFATVCKDDFMLVRKAINEKDDKEFNNIRQNLIKYESITDGIEYEIASYLNEVSKGELSERSMNRIKGMYKIIGELESLGDSCETIGRMIQRRIDHGKTFDEDKLKKLGWMMDAVENAFDIMIKNLKMTYSDLSDISNAVDAEYNINERRSTLREEQLLSIKSNSEQDYQTSVFFMDIVQEFEKMGDYIINISEAQLSENA